MYAQRGARTHDRWIKSLTLSQRNNQINNLKVIFLADDFKSEITKIVKILIAYIFKIVIFFKASFYSGK